MEEGAKNQTAAGRCRAIMGIAISRFAPQLINPIPIGKVPFRVCNVVLLSSSCAWRTWDSRSETSVPAPMNPIPPVRIR